MKSHITNKLLSPVAFTIYSFVAVFIGVCDAHSDWSKDLDELEFIFMFSIIPCIVTLIITLTCFHILKWKNKKRNPSTNGIYITLGLLSNLFGLYIGSQSLF